ncbi:hypothetical protein ACIQH0_36375 [Streptomyces griseus]|uniref:hypothetical protein n=1 Tax=Streptomyces griseus TaxID=1911 RepID=UPI00382406AA
MGVLFPTPNDSELDHAENLLLSILEKTGDGIHTLTLNAEGIGGSEHRQLHFAQNWSTGGFIPVDDMAVAFGRMLAILVAGTPGGIVLRTWGTKDTVRAWAFRDGKTHPLTELETFSAYCRNPETGEYRDPPEDVTYADAPTL